MRRTTRLSGQLPSPPKSFDGSLTSDSTCENNNTRSSVVPDENTSNTPSADRKTRVLRRQSTQNVSGELRAFFAVSALPSRKSKGDLLLAAVDRVSEFWEGPRKEPPRGQKRSQDDSVIPSKTQDPPDQPLKKRWLTSGLYAGSRTSADNSKILGKSRKSDPGPGAGRKFKFTMPLFHGKNLMEKQRDFLLPWNLYATTGQICKPPNWSRIKRSMPEYILIMLILDIHVDVDPYDKKADRPECLCQSECDEACLNRAMFYECDDQSCALDNPADCSNRTFQRGAIRYADHKAKSCGFEVFDVTTNLVLSDHRPVPEDLDCERYGTLSRMHSFWSIEVNLFPPRNVNIAWPRCTLIGATITSLTSMPILS
jgi:AWS domain